MTALVTNLDRPAALLMLLGIALITIPAVAWGIAAELRADRSGLPGALRRDDEWPTLQEWEDAS